VADPITIRTYRPGDETAILDCYNQIFPTPDGVIPKRSLAHWRWKFQDNPTGLLHHVVAEHEQEGIIGGYAGIPVHIWSEGRDQLAAQGVDLMVLPAWRRYGARPGLFVHLGWKYHELWCGAGDGKVLFTYGWPVPAWRMGQRYLGYLNIRDWDFTFRELNGATPVRAVPNDLEVRAVARFDAATDALFDMLKPTMGLALRRDARYLNWRYAARPDHRYVLLECRERGSGTLRGVAVHTVGNFVRPHTTFLVDWLARADDRDATVALLAAIEASAQRDRTGLIVSVWNHIDPRFLVLQELGYRVRGTPYFLVLATFKYDTIYYRDHWYFTMGDSDLI
jgi:hypothetical protein